MVVALAALKAGIRPEHREFCPGYMTLGRSRFHCWKRHGHGWVGMHDALQHSCDVYFYEISRRIGIDNIAAMANVFGLGERSEEHTSELQSLMRISYAVFCLKKKKQTLHAT